MTVRELIEQLKTLDPKWHCVGTNSGSIYVSDQGKEYGYVFFDGRPIRLLTHRK